MSAEPNQPTIEATLLKLEQLVARIESGELTLDESITAYEESMRLANTCAALLDAAELRITTIEESAAISKPPQRQQPASDHARRLLLGDDEDDDDLDDIPYV